MSKLRNQILLLGFEGDSGLWEVYGEAVGIFGQLSEQEIIDLASEVVLDLVSEGLIELHWTQEPLTRTWAIPLDEIPVLVNNTQYWDEPVKNAISIRLSSTETGRAAFLSPNKK